MPKISLKERLSLNNGHGSPTIGGSRIMPPTDKPDFTKLFEVFGLEFQRSGEEAIAQECPYCGKENHFYVNVETGQYDCKVCGKQGNAYTFIRFAYQQRLAATTDADYQRLKKLRGPPLQTLKRHGLAWDTSNGYWFIPYKSQKGEVLNLQRYRETTGEKRWLPRLPAQLYGLDQLSNDAGRLLFLCEGPFDAIALDYHLRGNKTRDRYDILAVPGATTFKPEWTKYLNGREARIVLDNDKAGRDGQAKVVKVCRDEKSNCRLNELHWPRGLPDGCDIDNLVRDGVNVVEFTRDHCVKIQSERRLHFLRGDEIKSQPKLWLWAGHIPCGSFISLEGDQGTFKSTIARDIAARATVGGTMPDGSPLGIPATDVLIFTGEDSADTVRDIVELHGGDLSRLHVHELELPSGDLLDILEVLPEIEATIIETGAKLNIIDPVNSFIGDYDTSTDVKARRNVTGKLHSFAKRTGIALIGLRNWGKSAEGSSTQRALGPSSMSHVCRCTLNTKAVKSGPPFFGKLEFSKVSDARQPAPIPFGVQDEGGHLRRILWGKEPPTVKEVLDNARAKRCSEKR